MLDLTRLERTDQPASAWQQTGLKGLQVGQARGPRGPGGPGSPLDWGKIWSRTVCWCCITLTLVVVVLGLGLVGRPSSPLSKHGLSDRPQPTGIIAPVFLCSALWSGHSSGLQRRRRYNFVKCSDHTTCRVCHTRLATQTDQVFKADFYKWSHRKKRKSRSSATLYSIYLPCCPH